MLDNVLFVLHRAHRITQMALALHEFSVTFKYRAGRANVAADCLSRLKSNYNESTTLSLVIQMSFSNIYKCVLVYMNTYC